MYFGQWCAAVMDGRILNEVGVGINPHGEEWNLLGQTMKSDYMMCGDFEKYDGSLEPELLWAVLDLINDWYNDEHQHIRRVLFAEIVNAVHQAGNLMYMMDHSNPSGNPLTAILNSVYQLVAMKYTMLSMGLLLSDIERKVKMIVYGDDNIMSVDGGPEFLRLDELTRALKEELGLSMTNADKNGPPVYTGIDEVDFLGRKFRLEDGRFYAPRPWENLSLVFNWQKSTMPWEALALQYSEACFFELSHYDHDGFMEKAQRVKKLYEDRGFISAPLFDIAFYRLHYQKWAGSGRDMLLCWGI